MTNANDILEIDTRGICLLCLSSCSQSVSGLSSIQGFEKLLRYLKVNTTELFNCSLQFLQTLEINEDIIMGITLCQKCSLVTESFDRLYKQYALIRIQFDNCVQSVKQAIKTGNESPGLVSEFNKRMRPLRLNDLLNASLANNLRNETFKKCSSKLQSSIPRVSVSKIEKETLIYTTTSEISTSTRLSTNADLNQSELQLNDTAQIEHIRLDNARQQEFLIENEDHEFSEEELEISINNAFSLTDTNSDPSSTYSRSGGGDTHCHICTQLIKRSGVRTHMIYMHPDTILSSYFPSNLVCTEELCKSAMQLLLSHVTLTDTGYNCPFCTISTSQRSKLKLHVMNIHTPIFANEVIEYARRRSQPDQMECEDSTDPLSEGVPSNPPLKVKCTLCTKWYKSIAHMNKHMVTVHGERKHICHRCSHATATVTNLKYHMKEVHLVEEVMIRLSLPPTCKVQCVQVLEEMLEEFKQSSTKCRHCEYKAANAQSLKRHVVVTHYDKFVNEVERRLGK